MAASNSHLSVPSYEIEIDQSASEPINSLILQAFLPSAPPAKQLGSQEAI
jgi:hypothetical protein